MKDRLLTYGIIGKACEGDPAAMQAVLDRYAGFIRYFAYMNGYYNVFAVGFQRMLIMVCMAIYAVLMQGIAAGGDLMGTI